MSISDYSTARSPIPWFGGKQRSAERIADLFPPHEVYIEVFGGGGSVMLTKPRTKLDVYNDRDDGLVTFFRVLRDQPEALLPLLELTPYSRTEYDICRTTWYTIEDDVERARRFYVAASQSFGGMVQGAAEPGRALSANAHGHDGGWSREHRPGRPASGIVHRTGRGWGGEKFGRMHLSRAASAANRIDHIWRFVERLRYVQVDNLDWRECLERYDAPGVLFYLDPPYVPETRKSGGYSHELTLEDHEELVGRLLELQGDAVISGYDTDVYVPLVLAGGYHRVEWDTICSAAQIEAGDTRKTRTEVLWLSDHREADTLFDVA